MRKDQFFDRHRNLSINQSELERKWRLLQEEEEMQALWEAAMKSQSQSQSSSGGAGGGGSANVNPQAQVISAKHVAVYYEDLSSGALKFFIVNYDNLTFSEEIELDPDYTSVNDLEFTGLVEGRGWIFEKVDSSNNRIFYFIDAGGNLIETVNIGNSSRNNGSLDGFASLLSYTDPISGLVTLKWWGGDTIYTETFNNVSDEYVYYDWFSWDSCTIDGTFSIYYYDTVLEKTRTYLVNAHTGVITEITDILGPDYGNGLKSVGNFMYIVIGEESSTESTVSYNEGDNFITLLEPNPEIKIGYAIPDISTFTGLTPYVIDIDGTTITINENVQGSSEEQEVVFQGERVETLRIIQTDGTYTDIDISVYNANTVQQEWLIGTNKLIIWLHADANGLDDTIISINPDDLGCWFISFDYNKVYGSYQEIQSNSLKSFSSWSPSPFGDESFAVCIYKDSMSDGRMTRYFPLKIIWSNAVTGELYSYEPETGGVLQIDPILPLPANPGPYGENQTYTNVAVINPTGFAGDTVTFDVVTDSNRNISTIAVNTMGNGYSPDDQVIIMGDMIGGSAPIDNITIDIKEVTTFGLSTNDDGLAVPFLLYVNFPDSTKLQLLKLKQNGSIDLIETVTNYESTGPYFNTVALGDEYVLLTHNDDSQAPNTQFWGIWDIQQEGFIDDDWIWTTTNNFWGTNYDTFYMADYSQNLTYWWNSAQGSLGNTITQLGTADFIDIYRNFNTNYIDYHRDGNTLIIISQDEAYILSSDVTPPAEVQLNGFLGEYDLNKTHLYNAWPDAENDNKYVIDVYDIEGSLIQTITTDFDYLYSLRVSGDRVYVVLGIESNSDLITYAITPTTYITKTVNKDGWDYNINEWVWWD
jgi:hypothetical protein